MKTTLSSLIIAGLLCLSFSTAKAQNQRSVPAPRTAAPALRTATPALRASAATAPAASRWVRSSHIPSTSELQNYGRGRGASLRGIRRGDNAYQIYATYGYADGSCDTIGYYVDPALVVSPAVEYVQPAEVAPGQVAIPYGQPAVIYAAAPTYYYPVVIGGIRVYPRLHGVNYRRFRR